MSARRVLVVMLAALALMLLSVPVATASGLEDYLVKATKADYAGEQATWCSFNGKTEFNVVSVEHAGSKLMVESGGTSQVLGDGRVSNVDASSGVALSHWSSVPLADRYVTSSIEPEERLGRDVVVVTVEENGQARARLWFDDQTGASLGSEVYDDKGDLFRLSWMRNFDSNPRRIYTVLGASSYDVVTTTDSGQLPQSVAGYERVDTYGGPNDSIHSFYSDGLFSYSVFQIEGEGAAGPFVDADTMKLDSGTYRWFLTASELWVQWSGSGKTYVLVGDLPPDHLKAVLAELPRAESGNLLSRIWSGIFG